MPMPYFDKDGELRFPGEERRPRSSTREDDPWENDGVPLMGRRRRAAPKPLSPEEDSSTSYGRFHIRAKQFATDGKPYPKLRHAYWWLLHNVVVHPLLGLFPTKTTFRWHDVTSDGLNHAPKRP